MADGTCRTTGRPLPKRAEGKRGPPPEYINQDARNVNAWVSALEDAVLRLGTEHGFTPEARKKLRGRIQGILNLPPLRPERDKG